MKKSKLSSLLVVLLLVAGVAAAQESQLFRAITWHTKLGTAPAFEEGVKEILAASKEAGLTYPINTWQSLSSPGDYVFVVPIATLNDITAQSEDLQKVFAKHPDVIQKLQSLAVSTEQGVGQARPDLSYVPANPRLAEADAPFSRLVWLSVDPARTADAETMLGEFRDLWAKHGVTDGFNVYTNVIGREGPMYIVQIRGASQADFFAHSEKNQEKFGAESQAILQKYAGVTRSVEYTESLARPDLSRQ